MGATVCFTTSCHVDFQAFQKGTFVGQKSSQQYFSFSESVHPQVSQKKSLHELLLGKIFRALWKGRFSSLALVLGKKWRV